MTSSSGQCIHLQARSPRMLPTSPQSARTHCYRIRRLSCIQLSRSTADRNTRRPCGGFLALGNPSVLYSRDALALPALRRISTRQLHSCSLVPLRTASVRTHRTTYRQRNIRTQRTREERKVQHGEAANTPLPKHVMAEPSQVSRHSTSRPNRAPRHMQGHDQTSERAC